MTVIETLRNNYNNLIRLVEKIKASRPRCPSSIDGTHCMVSYYGEKKVCIDCNYEEKIIVKEKW